MAVYKPIPSLSERQIAIFWDRVDRCDDASCWKWLGFISINGYGMFAGMRAHRVAYAIVRGDMPTWLVLDHLCRNKSCVNPNHLEAVTLGENTARSPLPTANHARKTHCVHGHEYTQENTIVKIRKGKPCRQCRLCDNDYDRRAWKAGKKKRGPNG